MLKAGVWPSPFKAPSKHGIGLLPWGGGQRRPCPEIYWKRMENVTHHTISSNLEGLAMPAERAPDNPADRVELLIFSELAFNPAADLDEFFRFKLSRLYGGEDAARLLPRSSSSWRTRQGCWLQTMTKHSVSPRQAAALSDRNGKERWTRLIEYIQSLK